MTDDTIEETTPTPTVGDNMPPIDADPLRDRLAEEHTALIERAKELIEAADRAPTQIDDEETASKMTDFIIQFGAAIKNSEAARKAEKEPFLGAGRTVDGFFKALTDPLAKAKAKLERPLTDYQRRKAAEERARREEEERLQREEAARAAQEAAEREAAAKDDADLDKAIEADERARQAAADAAAAEKAADAKPAELSRTRGDYGATASLRTEWKGEMLEKDEIDLEALRPFFATDDINKAIRGFVKAGGRELRGAKIWEHTYTVVR